MRRLEYSEKHERGRLCWYRCIKRPDRQEQEGNKKHDFIQSSLYDVNFDRRFDLAISTFTIEHLVHPQRLLEKMIYSVKVGGKIIVHCPEFRNYMNSISSGISHGTERDKIKRGNIVDALISWAEEEWVWNRVIEKVKKEVKFPIYKNPKCFHTEHFPDVDAVYVAEKEISSYLEEKGCVTLERYRNIAGKKPDRANSFCYVVAKREE